MSQSTAPTPDYQVQALGRMVGELTEQKAQMVAQLLQAQAETALWKARAETAEAKAEPAASAGHVAKAPRGAK